MPQTVVKTASDTNPLEQLSTLLQADMKQTNALILKNMESKVPLIPQLASYLIAAGGKRIRPLLTLASTSLYNGDMVRAHRLAACVEFIHSATLLHDDVVDESEERRGQETANMIFGNQASVLVGDFLFARAFQLMVADGSLEILRILSDAAATIAQGEVLQLAAANNIDTGMDDYIEIISAKTAALFAAACEVGPVIADQGKDDAKWMATYGMNLGIAFQIADDALDYAADHAKLGKTVGDDFREGKMTAPVILALKKANAEEKAFWRRTMADHSQLETDLKQAQDILARHDTIEQSLQLAGSYAAKAKDALKHVPPGELSDLLAATVDFSIRRAY